jgi:hypothetical protein
MPTIEIEDVSTAELMEIAESEPIARNVPYGNT